MRRILLVIYIVLVTSAFCHASQVLPPPTIRAFGFTTPSTEDPPGILYYSRDQNLLSTSVFDDFTSYNLDAPGAIRGRGRRTWSPLTGVRVLDIKAPSHPSDMDVISFRDVPQGSISFFGQPNTFSGLPDLNTYDLVQCRS
jgi:hypothetical protein